MLRAPYEDGAPGPSTDDRRCFARRTKKARGAPYEEGARIASYRGVGCGMGLVGS
jgi:hypothetical protein